jgi:site-specific DNA recombinase
MQLTFDGHSNEDFSRKLSGRVKSGHDKMSRDGKIAGGKCYGYNLVKDQPGERVTNETEAAIVRRIFTEYASGMTPRQIVAGLKRDGITSPTGKTVWNYQGICGADGGVTGAGMLHREFYRGKIVRDRIHYVKNPDTGRRVPRHSDADDIFTVDAPNLRIVSDDLWDAAHAVRRARRKQMNPNESNVAPTSALVRKPNLLGGLIRCSVCSGNMVIMSSARGGRIACSNATHRQTCDHTKSYAIDAITSEVIAKLDKELTDAEFLKRRMRARALELAKAEKEDNTERDQVQPDLERLKVQISRLVRALGDSDLPEDEIKAQMKIKEAQKAALSERLRLLGEGSNVTQILPAVMTAFGKDIETLIALLRRNPDDPRCRAALGNLIDCVVVHPTPKKQPYDLALYLRVSAIGNLKVFPKVRSHEKMLADEGVTYIASGNAPLPRINHFLSRHCY